VKIRGEYVTHVKAATTAAELHDALQQAIELEHATIPTYLTSLFSIKPGQNPAAAHVLRSVVNEEMLHMSIAANVLNAIGGNPRMSHPGFIPVFPGPLPMGIGDGLIVTLEKLTRGHVQDVFMAIEEPDHPLDFNVREPSAGPLLAAAAPPPANAQYATIGDFYTALIAQIAELGQGIFTGNPARQVVDNTWFPADQMFPIKTVDDATRALTVIIDQGEGTRLDPDDGDGEPAHYYRFAEIVYARRLVKDPKDPKGWSYSGAPVPIDPAGVWNLYPNAKSVDYAPGSLVRVTSDQFNYSYTSLLASLEETFNGNPAGLKASLAVMFELNLLAGKLVSFPIPGTDFVGAPTFEYTPIPV
jgi:hypothetical protein